MQDPPLWLGGCSLAQKDEWSDGVPAILNIKEENYSEGDLYLSYIYVDKIFINNNIKKDK